MRVSSQEIKGIKLIKYNKVKVCSKCGQEKSLNEFTKDKYMKSGYKSSCKQCNKKQYSTNTIIKNKICKKCGQEKPISDFYKDKGCKDGYRATCKICVEANKTRNGKTRVCEYCNKPIPKKSNGKYCSDICCLKAKSEEVEFYCDYCGKLNTTSRKLYKRFKNHFCNDECCKKFHVGENGCNYNPDLTDEEREEKRNIKGYDEFVQMVLKRDNYTCQCCGECGRKLAVHHLNGYNWDKENRINPDNAVVLCENCHKEFHHIYGYGNNTKEQFEEFINNNTNKTA